MSESGWGKYEDKVNSTTPSKLAEMSKSPKHFYSSYILQEREPTPAMDFGTMAHKYLLEPEEFHKVYAVPPPDNLIADTLKTLEQLKSKAKDFGLKISGTKAELTQRIKEIDQNIKFYDEVYGEYMGGREPVTEGVYKRLVRMKEEISKHAFANKLILGKGENEVSGYFMHKETQTVIRFRIDKLYKLNGKYVVVDLKATDKINRRQFESNIWDLKLHLLASLYVDAIKAITGEEALFCWCCVQSKPPYIVNTFVSDFGCLEAGRTEATQAIIAMKYCKEKNHWPGPDESLINVSLPSYAWGQIEEIENEGIIK